MAQKKQFKRFTAKQVKATLKRLKGERGTWENHWQEVTDYILPRKNTVLNSKSPGQKRTWQLLDNIGVYCNELLAGALQGMLTNPDLPWFEFTTGDIMLDQQDDVAKWLQNTARRVLAVLNNSNFQTEVHELYIDIGSIGTSLMQIEDDDETVVRFSTKFIAEYFIKENNRGFVDQVYREWKWDAQRIVQEFGIKNVPPLVQKAYEKGDESSKFCVIHAVYPKKLLDGEDTSKMPYASQYFISEEDFEISVGDFGTFPFAVPRWSKAAGEEYGRSPGMNALPELKVLNKMNETMLKGAQKMVDPPLQLPDDGFVMPLETGPAGLNFYRSGTTDLIKPIFNDTNVEFGYQAMQDRRQRVKDSYYVDQLKLPPQQNTPMTATEVMQRTEEAMRLLGPLLGRMNSEFLRPLIQRVYNIMVEKKLIDQAPDALAASRVDVRYSSLIAKSQRVNEAQGILRTMGAAASFIQISPAAAQNFDADAAVRLLGQYYGAPTQIFKSQKDVAALRDAQMQAQQQAQQQQQQQQTIDNSLQVVQATKAAQTVAQ